MSLQGWDVVKIGGELVAEPARLARTVGAAVAALHSEGRRVLVVHGGGPQASALTAKLGLEKVMVGGRRVTDAATLEVMKMALAGQASVDAASAFVRAGVPALCTTGVSASLVRARKRPPRVVSGSAGEAVDFGFVGDVESVDVAALERLTDAGFVPVLGSLCADTSGQPLNINADTVAAHVASGLRAERLFLVSNVPGVLADREDPSTRIPTLTPEQARARIEDGTIQGGMIPKVEESLALLERGIGSVHVLGLDPEDGLLQEARTPGSCGTAFLRG